MTGFLIMTYFFSRGTPRPYMLMETYHFSLITFHFFNMLMETYHFSLITFHFFNMLMEDLSFFQLFRVCWLII